MDDFVGTVVGIYEVQYLCDYRAKDGHAMYHVKCAICGKEQDLKKIKIKKTRFCRHVNVHGNYVEKGKDSFENKRIADIFYGMKNRCYRTSCEDYKRYGERGIKICDEWINNPKSFENWAMYNGYQDDLTIDRVDVDKGYCPENCRWVTLEENVKYKSTTSLIEVDGEVHTGRDWARILGFGLGIINRYVRKYGKDKVVELIRLRLRDKTKTVGYKQSWMDVYGLSD